MRAATVVQVLQDFEAPPTIAPRPPTTVANPHIDRSLGSKVTHIQSHNRVYDRPSCCRVCAIWHRVLPRKQWYGGMDCEKAEENELFSQPAYVGVGKIK